MRKNGTAFFICLNVSCY